MLVRRWTLDVLIYPDRVRFVYYRLPYVLLVLATAFAMCWPQTASHRWLSLLLVGVAAAWMLCAFSLPPQWWRTSPVAMAGYVVGLLVISAALTLHDGMFFLFALTVFFHAFLIGRLLPTVLILVAATAVVNLAPGGWHNPFADGSYPIYLTIMLVQVVTVTFGTLSSVRVGLESEERRRTVVRLEAVLAENSQLQERLLTNARATGVAEERARLAREIHDTLAQGLIGIITQLQVARNSHDEAEWARRVDTAAELARDSLTEARRSVHALRPDALAANDTGRSGLAGALSDVAGRWSQRNGIPAEVVTTGTARPMHPEVEVTLLRTTQEALANVARHAGASRVGLTLSYMEDLVRLDVRDDGVGFADSSAGAATTGAAGGSGVDGGGFGLVAMRERIGALSGRLEIESEPGAGTAMSASVPAIPGGAA